MNLIKQQSIARAALIAIVYMVLAGVYIIASSLYAKNLATDVENLARIETLKGVLFVVITGLFLFFFTESQLRRMGRHRKSLEVQRLALLKSEQRAIAGLYASALAHDANNMLAAVGMGLDSVCQSGPLNEPQKQSFDTVKRAIQQLESINQRLIGSSSGLVVPAVAQGAQDLIKAAIRLVRMHETLSSKHFTIDCQSDFKIKTDPLMLQQSVINLILNAGEAVSPLGKIAVVIKQEGTQGIIEVHDDGPGIAPEIRDRLFDPFFTTKTGGHGLGLVAVRGFVEMSKGSIEVETSPLGGACFRMILSV